MLRFKTGTVDVWINPALVRSITPGGAGICTVAFDQGYSIRLAHSAEEVVEAINRVLIKS